MNTLLEDWYMPQNIAVNGVYVFLLNVSDFQQAFGTTN